MAARADEADAAWLAGVPVIEPPPDPDGAPEPPPEPSFEAVAESRPAGPRVRETPRQSAERQARQASQASVRADQVALPDGDEPSADDPDIVSTGLVGVPLVVQILGGKVIDEIVEGQ
jgi:DNA polymerase-3 subunit gamma/tau